MTKEDKLTGRQTGGGAGGGRGELRGGDVPSRRVSPCTLLSYEGGFHSRWPQRRGEEGGVSFFFLTNNCVSRLCSGRGDWGGSVRVGAPIRRSPRRDVKRLAGAPIW